MTRARRSTFVAGIALLAAWSATRDAAAAGFASAYFGGEQGTVVATNPTALYYNPAGIGFSQGIHLYLDGEIAMRSASWSHTAPPPGPSDQPNSQYGNSGTARLFNVFGGPALGMTMGLGDHLVVGAGLFVPFGGRVDFGQNASVPTASPEAGSPTYGGCADAHAPVCPLAANGVQRWHITTAALTFIQASVGGALRFGPLSVGATGNFINSQISESQSHTLGTGAIDSTGEDTAALNVSGNNLSFAAGVMLEVVPKHLWLAGSYQAQPGLGPQTLKGTLDYSSGPSAYYSSSGAAHYDVDFHESLPDIIRGGLRARINDSLEVRVYGDFTRWSVMTNQCVNISSAGTACQVYGPANSTPLYPLGGGDATPKASVITNIPRDWRNTYDVHLSASYWLNPEIEVFAGVGYGTGATPDATLEPGAMDANNVTGSLGGRFEVAHNLYLAASYTQIQYMNRTVTTSQLESYAVPSFSESGDGQYQQWIGIFDVNAEKKF